MCNLYGHTNGQQGIIEFSRAMTDRTSNLPPQPGICQLHGANRA